MQSYFLCFFFFSFFSYIAIAFDIATAIGDEVSALISIKSGLIDPLDLLQDWKFPADGQEPLHCNWRGIQCNSDGGVESLDLSHMNLSGHLSGDIQRLPSLRYLNLSCNLFSSSLPKDLSNLTLLKRLDLSQNLFSGGFPAGLGSSAGLLHVNASGNSFSGLLPEDIGNATSVESLDFRGSFFEGSIPASYKNLQRLKFLGVSGNNLTGPIPAQLGELSSLETLIIGYNEFEGKIPAALGNLTNLRYLDMAIGNIGGAIPAELGKLNLLNTLFLFNNNIEGEIPKEMGNMSSLALLDLSDNQITGRIPAELAQLRNLQLLSLMRNQLVGPLPAVLGDLTQLEVLELWNNTLTGPLPATIGRNSSLQWLDVSSNSFSGEMPIGLCNGGSLTKLILFNNGFTGPIPSSLTTCLPLVRVRMQNNRLSGTIPTGLGKLPGLQRLELAGNDLSGEIPDDISSSTSLSFIDLSHNHLQLSLPSNILSMPNLQSFMASDNEFTGEIPEQFQDCPSLTVLNLSNNNLSGNIPGSLASCQKLVNLNLQNNRFTGEIPMAIAMMPTLAILDLSTNQLTGTIPNNFGSSPALEMLNLSYNNLFGPVPANGILRTISPEDLAGNSGLCGGVLPSCTGELAAASSPSRQTWAHLKHIVTGWVIGISVVLAIGTAILVSRWVYKKWYLEGWCRKGMFHRGNGEWPWRLTVFQRLNFTGADVLPCIKECNVIGMGATGIVYKAELQRHHITVAVKKLWRSGTAEAGDAEAPSAGDIAGEVNLLGRLRHRNIVRLLGYLHNESDKMIVCEYMPNGSLWEALHGEQSGQVLVDWMSRYNVATGVAQGLAYLHHDCHPPIIHRDIKSNNILLDANFEARIADFGLARIMVRKNETVSMVAGSYGYIAPEYGYTLKVDQKSDIYSFGVVLMELLTGKRPIQPEFGECQDIVGWIRENLRNDRGIEVVLDPNVGGHCQHVKEEMVLVLRIAVLCTAKSPKDRPSMRDVLSMLAEAKPRRKSSSSTSIINNVFEKDKPVFTTSPQQGYL